MSYLSRIWINPLRKGGSRLLGNPQALHAAVLGGIVQQPVDERVLWRLDVDDPHRPALLVLTESSPSWEHIVEQAGWPSSDDRDDPQVVTRPYDRFLARLTNGQEYAFRLAANPTQSTRRPGKLTPAQQARAVDGELARSTRIGHRTVEHQTAWLLKRTEGWGFVIPPASSAEAVGDEVPDVRVATRDRRSFARSGGGNGRSRVTIQAVTFEGRLIVADAAVLRDRMVAGMGPAKAYGCGLLTLAALPSSATVAS